MAKIKTIKTNSFEFNMKKINPLFSESKIYVMYHGENRNSSKIDKKVVEMSLDTIKNIPIVGEFIERDGEGNFGGHGGKIELTDDDIKFVHTTKPIGLIPESAKIYWETIKDKKDREREYLVVEGALFWNRHAEEVSTLKKDNFGQSMEIEVLDGYWNEDENLYEIKDFAFSALCILGIDKDGEGHVEPAFEDAKVITYSLDKNTFKNEFSQMLKELNFSLSENSEDEEEKEDDTMLKELLAKYSVTMEYLTEKGLKFEEISEEDLEDKIKEVLEVEPTNEEPTEPTEPTEPSEPTNEEPTEPTNENTEEPTEPTVNEFEVENTNLKAEIEDLKSQLSELETLREFKANIEKANHEAVVEKMLNDFQLTQEDIKDLDIHNFSKEEIEDECYKILGRKIASKKKFSKDEGTGSTRLPIDINDTKDEKQSTSTNDYDDLFEKYSK